MSTRRICLGAVLVLGVFAVAYYLYRRHRSRSPRARFTLGTPATPAHREAACALLASLRGAATAHGAALAAYAAPHEGAVLDLAPDAHLHAVGTVLGRVGDLLAGAPPTYANYLAVYRGLAPASGGLASAAQACEAAGRDFFQEAAREVEGAPSAQLVALGATHRELARALDQVNRAAHRFGAALDLE